MKPKWEKVIREKMTENYRNRLLEGAGPLLEKNAATAGPASLWAWLFRPVGGLAMAGAVAAMVLGGIWLARQNDAPTDISLVALDADMLQEADMFLDLPLLERLNELEKMESKKKWPNKKSSG